MSKGSTVAIDAMVVVASKVDAVEVESAIVKALAFVKEKIKTKANRVSRPRDRLDVFDMFVLYSLDKEVARGGDKWAVWL